MKTEKIFDKLRHVVTKLKNPSDGFERRAEDFTDEGGVITENYSEYDIRSFQLNHTEKALLECAIKSVLLEEFYISYDDSIYFTNAFIMPFPSMRAIQSLNAIENALQQGWQKDGDDYVYTAQALRVASPASLYPYEILTSAFGDAEVTVLQSNDEEATLFKVSGDAMRHMASQLGIDLARSPKR